jgi:D-glycero-D-manno-heptose 1,7-bisphosphate phosphatase
MRESDKKALFLDRDGVVNKDFDYVHRIEDFHFQDGIMELCQKANDKGYLIFIITNQAGIARGYYTERQFIHLTKWMVGEFKKNNVPIRKVFYCPYHYEEGVGKYKQHSNFRKPNPGMILKAARRYSIDLSRSILIGDQYSDIKAGLLAGVERNLLILSPKIKKTINDLDAIEIHNLRESLSFLI